MITKTDELRKCTDEKVEKMIESITTLGNMSATDKRKIRRYIKDMVTMVRDSEKQIILDFMNRI